MNLNFLDGEDNSRFSKSVITGLSKVMTIYFNMNCAILFLVSLIVIILAAASFWE